MKYVHWICDQIWGTHNLKTSSSFPVRLHPEWTSSNPRCNKRGKPGHFKRKVCFAESCSSSRRTSALGPCLAPSPPLRGTTRCSCEMQTARCVDALLFWAVAKLFVAGALPWRRRQLQGKGRPDRGLSAVSSPGGDDLVGHGVFDSLRCWLLPNQLMVRRFNSQKPCLEQFFRSLSGQRNQGKVLVLEHLVI